MATHRDSSRYEGEDNEPTSKRELWGWYCYGLAAEVFAVCGVGSFLPVTLEQLAREVGVLRSDKTSSCIQSKPNPTRLLKRDDNQCVVYVFGYELNTSSFALYSFSLAILVQTHLLISIGAIADHGGNRKNLLLAFSFIGATASMLFIIVFPRIYLLGLFLTIISVSCLGASFVLLNSFLPLLVANHPSIRDDYGADSVPLNTVPSDDPNQPDEDDTDEEDPFHDDLPSNGLLNGQPRTYMPLYPDKVSPTLKLSNHISSKGVGIGYAAAVFVQIISIGIILLYNKFQPPGSSSTMPMRTVLFVVGLWWAAFTIPTALWLRRRPGPPLPLETGSMRETSFTKGMRYVSFAWKSLWRTVRMASQLRQVLIFLLGWFLLSDGVATISGTAILFARTELEMGTAAVALLSITATASGIAGAFFWPIIGRRFELNSIAIVLSCVFLFEFIPLYGLLGFVPFVKNLGFLGLQQAWEIYPLGFLLGFIMGGISSYCRSIFGSLIPPGMEAAFYALYAVTDKGSSFIGPAIVGRIIDVTGSIRMGFWFLSILMISPAPFFWFVDVEKGREEGLKMAQRWSKTTYDAETHQ